MTVEEAEEVFGKRWAFWSLKEQREFVSALETPEELTTPVACNLVMQHLEYASAPVREWVEKVEKA
jgi:hypothetical protein